MHSKDTEVAKLTLWEIFEAISSGKVPKLLKRSKPNYLPAVLTYNVSTDVTITRGMLSIFNDFSPLNDMGNRRL